MFCASSVCSVLLAWRALLLALPSRSSIAKGKRSQNRAREARSGSAAERHGNAILFCAFLFCIFVYCKSHIGKELGPRLFRMLFCDSAP